MRFALLASLVLVGCVTEHGSPLEVSPAHASMFGQTEVTFRGDLASLGAVNYFAVGGVQIYNARWSATSVTATVQGAPTAGPAEIVLVGTQGYMIHHGLFTYDPPVDKKTP